MKAQALVLTKIIYSVHQCRYCSVVTVTCCGNCCENCLGFILWFHPILSPLERNSHLKILFKAFSVGQAHYLLLLIVTIPSTPFSVVTFLYFYSVPHRSVAFSFFPLPVLILFYLTTPLFFFTFVFCCDCYTLHVLCSQGIIHSKS